MLLSSIETLLKEYVNEGENSEAFQNKFKELMRISAHSEQTFLITQALLNVMSLKVRFIIILLTFKENR